MVTVTLDEIAAKYHSQLEKVCRIQNLIEDVHPFLKHLFPIALVENDQFFIFDVESGQKKYHPIKQTPTPMPIPVGIRAAFPLDCYDGKPTCVVTGEVFDTLEGYATLFHEFMHCQQWQTCEPKLRQMLGIARQAQSENDSMWELNYPFPYGEAGFIKAYQTFLSVSGEGDKARVSVCRIVLKQNLSERDYEYMVWEEWKEGFARFIENLVRCKLSLEENHHGQEAPFDRVVFYEGGAQFIRYLHACNPVFSRDLEALFHRMLSGA